MLAGKAGNPPFPTRVLLINSTAPAMLPVLMSASALSRSISSGRIVETSPSKLYVVTPEKRLFQYREFAHGEFAAPAAKLLLNRPKYFPVLAIGDAVADVSG
jgi:hypothetical protein